MGKMKELAIEQEEQMSEETIQAAQQEEYYWYILREFLAINKVFGQTKVLSDLKALRESVEPKKKEEPRIIIPG